MLDIYTDGACSQAGKSEGPGGWGVYVVQEDLFLYGKEKITTNNKMELTAFLKALEHAINTEEKNISIYTDSAYIANCINLGWYKSWIKNARNGRWLKSNKQPVKNQDYWEQIVDLYNKLKNKAEVKVIKIKAHNNNKYNDIADMLAVKGRNEVK